MTWQHFATGVMVIFAAALILRRLPWFAARSGGCSGCNSCPQAASPQPASLVQLGMPSAVKDQR